MYEIAALVEAGTRAPDNDDRAAINATLLSLGPHAETAAGPCLAVVCDGVGGEAHGDVAAEIAAGMFSRISGQELTAEIIGEHIEKANMAVCEAQLADHGHARMSSTLAGIYLCGDDYIAFNVGDTRVYRYRSFISRLSKDHSARQEQIDLGLPPKAGENIITRYLGGTQAFPEIVEGKGRLLPGDVFILCTDGVWGVLSDDDFEDVLGAGTDPAAQCRTLVDMALQKGSNDNLSIVIIRRT